VEDPAMLTYEQASEITRKKMMRWKSKTHFRSAKPAPAHSTPDLLP
jgi:hypothetical protein